MKKLFLPRFYRLFSERHSALHQHIAFSCQKPLNNPIQSVYENVDLVEFWSSNAMHAANYYIDRFGFNLVSYQN
jgi:hypothetical protein